MKFRLFGVRVEVTVLFWICSAFLGLSGLASPQGPRGSLAVWMVLSFASVLIHELGRAFAAKRLGLTPRITLHGLGGSTEAPEQVPLPRNRRLLIPLAGLVASFAFGGLVHVVLSLDPGLPGRLGPLGQAALTQLRWVSLGWALINLAPTLPFDGGVILALALVPPDSVRAPSPRTRESGVPPAQLAGSLSTAVAFALAMFFVRAHKPWGAFLFGLAAIWNFRRSAERRPPWWSDDASGSDDDGASALAVLLRQAQQALEGGDYGRAATLAQQVIEGHGGETAPSPSMLSQAFYVLCWIHLIEGRTQLAAEVLADAQHLGAPDPALAGAVYLARGEFMAARTVLEAAWTCGDHRKEIAGLLVQTLIAQQEVQRAADIAMTIVDALSNDDVRTMAAVAYEHGAFEGASCLCQEAFEREHRPEDAYAAARAEAQAGHSDRALLLLRCAIEAGFTDHARAWSDAALASLHRNPQMETVVPRP